MKTSPTLDSSMPAMNDSGTTNLGDPVERIREALRCGKSGCKCRTGETVHCVSHRPDSDPSLSITKGDEQPVVVHCHAGCTQEDVIAALKEKQLWFTGKPSAVARTRRYEYPSQDGKVLATKVRHDYDDGTKTLFWEPKGTKIETL